MSNDLKNPLFHVVPAIIRKKIGDIIAQEGSPLPCHVTGVSGAMITVAFDVLTTYVIPQITIPLFGPEYIRYPIKIGDLGVTVPVDAGISYTTGQGTGLPDLSQPGNFESLFFMPIGNKNWVPVDPNQVTVYAPNGATIRDTNSGAVIVLHPTQISITVGTSSWVMDGTSITETTETYKVTATTMATISSPVIVLDGQMSQGTGTTKYPSTLQGPLTVVNDVTAEGTSVHTHVHGGVQSGGSDTDPPT